MTLTVYNYRTARLSTLLLIFNRFAISSPSVCLTAKDLCLCYDPTEMGCSDIAINLSYDECYKVRGFITVGLVPRLYLFI